MTHPCADKTVLLVPPEVEPPLVLLTYEETIRRTTLSRRAIHVMLADNRFPKPVTVSDRRVAFVEAEVDAWIKERMEARE